ncbi:DedA family protein [Nocardioides korecus]
MTDALVGALGALGPWSLVVLALVAFAETGLLVGFLIPGDTVVLTAGVLIASGVMGVPVAVALVVVALSAALGDQTAYLVGRRFGPRVLSREGSRLLSPRHVGHAQRFFERHGPKAVVLARFVPVARTMTPVVAGVGSMGRRRFSAYNLVGAVAWTLLTLGGGYLFGGIPVVADHVGLITLLIAGLSTTPVLYAVLRRRLAGPSSPDAPAPAGAPAALPVVPERELAHSCLS